MKIVKTGPIICIDSIVFVPSSDEPANSTVTGYLDSTYGIISSLTIESISEIFESLPASSPSMVIIFFPFFLLYSTLYQPSYNQ